LYELGNCRKSIFFICIKNTCRRRLYKMNLFEASHSMKCFTAHTFALPLFPLYRRNVVFIELYTSSTFCTPDWLLFSFKASATRGKATENRPESILLWHSSQALALFFINSFIHSDVNFSAKTCCSPP
jgi:hypothetical protein